MSMDGRRLQHRAMCVILPLAAALGASLRAAAADAPPCTPGPVARFRSVLRSKDVEAFSRSALELRRWMIARDPHRPVYHFTAPEAWINDPNGVIYAEGRYHLFYQYSPVLENGSRSPICWGHAVSSDLVHWKDWPVAMWPDTRYDQGGVYSGNTVIDDAGQPVAFYTGNVRDHAETYGIMARSSDGWLTWDKQMVMDDRQRPNANSPVHWDGQVWKDGGTWYQLIGGTTGQPKPQGAAWLWSSPDLRHWTLRKNIAESIRHGQFWELPYLVPLDGRHVLMVGCGNPYWIGRYDKQTMSFAPEDQRPQSMDNGNYYSFNPNMVDDKGPGGGPRRIMHGWVTGPASPVQDVPYWQGAHSLPRVLRLRDNRVRQEPVPELQALRGQHDAFGDLRSAQDGLRQIRGDALEIAAVFEPGPARQFGLKLRVSPDGKEYVRVWVDALQCRFGVDGPALKLSGPQSREIVANGSQESYLKPGEPVDMRVFLDRSVLEVYVNGVAQTARPFSSPKALGLELLDDGGRVRLRNLHVWQMTSSWK
jgi:sucrose-6-phosphate hydrolase SacC (GH32 family)